MCWKPDIPKFEHRMAWSKFRKAYNAARTQFATEMASVLGGAVVIYDPEDKRMETVMPPTKQ